MWTGDAHPARRERGEPSAEATRASQTPPPLSRTGLCTTRFRPQPLTLPEAWNRGRRTLLPPSGLLSQRSGRKTLPAPGSASLRGPRASGDQVRSAPAAEPENTAQDDLSCGRPTARPRCSLELLPRPPLHPAPLPPASPPAPLLLHQLLPSPAPSRTALAVSKRTEDLPSD